METPMPQGDLGLVFPNGVGKVESHSNVLERGLHPNLKANGLVEVVQSEVDGELVAIETPRYGMHSLRHACASLWIESGYNPKQTQRLMGHSSIKVTFDVYGHLFADADADQKAAENVQFRLLGA
jgi:integrase